MTSNICLCKAMRPTLVLCRLFGLLAIYWKHENGRCVFKVSKFWIIYSLIIAVLDVGHIYTIIPVILTPFNADHTELLGYIASLNENLISMFILILILINIFRTPRICKVLNTSSGMSEYDLLCETSLKSYALTHKIFACIMFLQYFIQFSVSFAFTQFDSFEYDWNFERFFMPVIHNTSFLFYSIFGSQCTLSSTILFCYETKVINVIQYKPVHPMKDFIRNKVKYPFFWKDKKCDDAHMRYCTGMKTRDRLEFLQNAYLQIQLNLDNINAAFNPQLLLHLTIELIIMILHWYAVIVYFTYDKVTPNDNTNNFFHWYYVIVHTWALFVCMSMAQQIETKIQRIKCIFLEYSTGLRSAEEFLIMRIFINQLNNYRSFSASGIIPINLQILAPISANVLMYVLVALQFKFPKSTKNVN